VLIKKFPKKCIVNIAALSSAGSGGSLDPATTAWINAVVSDGGSVSGTQQTRVNTLIVALKAASYSGGGTLFAAIDRLWLYGGESNAHQAKIDIIALASHTVNGSPTLAAGGYTGDAAAAFLNTGFNPSTAGGHFTQNSASIGSYNRTNRSTGQLYADFGAFGFAGGNDARFFPCAGGTPTALWELNQNVQDLPNNANSQGSWALSRTGAGAGGAVVYKNGNTTPVFTGGQISQTVPNGNFFVLADNNNGSAGGFSGDQLAAFWIAGGFTSTDVSNFETALNAYMNSWGISIH
jgi:hypothetical protein